VLSGGGLCDELITRPEESYRLWCVVVCDLETSRIGTPYIYIYIYIYIYTHTYDISSLSVNDLTLILLTWRKWWAPNNASKQQMGFNSAFKGLMKAFTDDNIILVRALPGWSLSPSVTNHHRTLTALRQEFSLNMPCPAAETRIYWNAFWCCSFWGPHNSTKSACVVAYRRDGPYT